MSNQLLMRCAEVGCSKLEPINQVTSRPANWWLIRVVGEVGDGLHAKLVDLVRVVCPTCFEKYGVSINE